MGLSDAPACGKLARHLGESVLPQGVAFLPIRGKHRRYCGDAVLGEKRTHRMEMVTVVFFFFSEP